MAPTAFAEEPITDPTPPTESPSPDPSPSADPSPAPSPEPSVEPSPEPTTSPDPSPEPSPTTEPSPEPSPSEAPSVTDSLIVRLVPGLSSVEEAAVLALGGGVETSAIPALRMHVVEVAAATSADSIAAYRADPRVDSVDRDRVREAEATPDDPSYPDQWALPAIGWDQAYGVTDPAGSATIAVLDTGVDAVGDLSVVGGYSALGGGTGDANGHGTWMASIAAATVNNGTGIAGVGYDGVSVMPVKVLSADGTGQDSDIISGVVWAADHGADVILMAFSNPGYSQALQDAIDYAWSRGAVSVAAVGNDGSTSPTYPAGDAKVVGVAATNQDDTLWSGSNSGEAAFISAPGVGISANDTSGTTSVTGTSASAAIVAGAAALLKANDPAASNGTVVGRLARNTDAGGAGNGRLNLARSLSDVATDEVVPVGAPGGGPSWVPTSPPRSETSSNAGTARSRASNPVRARCPWKRTIKTETSEPRTLTTGKATLCPSGRRSPAWRLPPRTGSSTSSTTTRPVASTPTTTSRRGTSQSPRTTILASASPVRALPPCSTSPPTRASRSPRRRSCPSLGAAPDGDVGRHDQEHPVHSGTRSWSELARGKRPADDHPCDLHSDELDGRLRLGRPRRVGDRLG